MRTLNTSRIIALLNHILATLPDRWHRRRIQSPRTILATLLILAIERGVTSTRRALFLLRDLFPEQGRKRLEPCPAAFSRARLAMTEEMLRSLFTTIADSTPDEVPELRVNGFRIIAMDGSQISVPRSASTLKGFGCYTHSRTSHQPQSRLVVAWDVLGRRPIDWVVGTCFASERAAAIHMAPRLPQKSIVLLDRGFQGVGAIQVFSQAGIGCFMRVRSGKTTWNGVQRFLKGRANDATVVITGIVDGEPVTLTCRAVKATRINTRKGTEETVVFLTNLMDRNAWPRTLLLKLYSLRWDIETSFRELKVQDRIEGFHSSKAAGIKQEIAAYMIARLLAGILLAQVARINPGHTVAWNHPRRHVFNNCSLIHATSDIILACARKISVPVVERLLDVHVLAISSSAQRRRPGRTYIRKCKGRYGRWKGTKNHRSDKGRNSQLSL